MTNNTEENKEKLRKAQRDRKVHAKFKEYFMSQGNPAIVQEIIKMLLHIDPTLSSVFANDIQKHPELAKEVAKNFLNGAEYKTLERLFNNLDKWIASEGLNSNVPDHRIFWHNTSTVKIVKAIAEDFAKLEKYVMMVPNTAVKETYRTHKNYIGNLIKKWDGEQVNYNFNGVVKENNSGKIEDKQVPMPHRKYVEGIRKLLNDLKNGNFPHDDGGEKITSSARPQETDSGISRLAREKYPAGPPPNRILETDRSLAGNRDLVAAGSRLFSYMMRDPVKAKETWTEMLNKRGNRLGNLSEDEQALFAFDASMEPDSIMQRINRAVDGIRRQDEDDQRKKHAKSVRAGERLANDALKGNLNDVHRLDDLLAPATTKMKNGRENELTENERNVYYYDQERINRGQKGLATLISERTHHLRLINQGKEHFAREEAKVLSLWAALKARNFTNTTPEEEAIKAYYDSLGFWSSDKRKLDKAKARPSSIGPLGM
jgi:hypothetical protein